MTNDERARMIGLLRDTVAESSQERVAQRIGRSAAAVNQVLKGVYKGNTDAVLERVKAELAEATTECPLLGTISLSYCIDSREREFRPTNHQRVRLWSACQTCERNSGGKAQGRKA